MDLNETFTEYMERMDDIQRMNFSDIEGLMPADWSEIQQVTEYKSNAFLSLTDDYSRSLGVGFQDIIDYWIDNTTTEVY